MEHVELWERSKGKKWAGGLVVRNEVGAEARVYDCRVCGQVCRSKSGLVNHRRRTHEESAAKKTFTCGKCGQVFKIASEKNHLARVCGGAVCVGKVQ